MTLEEKILGLSVDEIAASASPAAPIAEHSAGRERPILFSGPMVRALLAGTKTQTRRVVKSAPPEPEAEAVMVRGALCFGRRGLAGTAQETFHFTHGEEGDQPSIRCPYGVPGDVLWVREACWLYGRWDQDGLRKDGRPAWTFRHELLKARHDNPGHEAIAYQGQGNDGWSWRPGIHMPRWASRLSLRITDVRVERLNDCSWEDAIAEGLKASPDDRGLWLEYGRPSWDDQGVWLDDPRRSYRSLWEQINGAGSWDANPWVWAVSFEVVQ